MPQGPNTAKKRGSGKRTTQAPPAATPEEQERRSKNAQNKKGTPGIDFSGVHPETGKYTVVRGTHVGQNKRINKKAKTYAKGEINPKAPLTPMDRQRKDMKICGAHRTGKSASGEGICCQAAGWGTDHLGYGHCRYHGGLTESQEKAVQFQRVTDMMQMYGSPIHVDPHEALLAEVHRAAGHVQWLGSFIAEFENSKQLTQMTEAGITPSVWIEMYHRERDRLVKASQTAISAGVAERQTRIAEEQGRMFAMVISKIFQDPRLHISNEQRIMMPSVVRDHLMALEAGPLEVPLLKDIPEAELVE
jgi:hypothetical protein